MNRQWVMRGLLASILLQVGVLAAEYLDSVYPLWTGREIRLETVPVDPRSMFRGNYVRLSYVISQIDMPPTMESRVLRHNEIVYVRLRPGENNIHVPDGISFTKPASGLFIRGRLQYPAEVQSRSLRVSYGIEAFFAPKEKAVALEEKMRQGGVAVVMLAANGKPALVEIASQRSER